MPDKRSNKACFVGSFAYQCAASAFGCRHRLPVDSFKKRNRGPVMIKLALNGFLATLSFPKHLKYKNLEK